MVSVFLADTADLPDPLETPRATDGLPEIRREKALRPVRAEDRRLALGAGLLLAKVLPQFGASAEEIYIDENGKPSHPKVFFNLSHSGTKVALAVSEKGEVGCDIERLRPVPARLAEKFSAEGEEFFRLWTRRESYVKYTGEGLKGLRDFETEHCAFRVYEIEGYVLTVCAEEGEFGLLQTVSLG